MKAHGGKEEPPTKKCGGSEEKAYREQMSSQSTKYGGQDSKRREPGDYKDSAYYSGGSRRRYDHAPSDNYRRHYGPDERSRQSRYSESRDYYSDSRNPRGHRSDWRSYNYDDDPDHYGDSRGYRNSRYEDNVKYRKSNYYYDDRDRYERGDRYDRYRRSGRSYSPQTPSPDRRSPNNQKRAYNSAPPPPPNDVTDSGKGGTGAAAGANADGMHSKHDRTGHSHSSGKSNAPAKESSHSQGKQRGDAKSTAVGGTTTQDEGRVTDPRTMMNLYASRMTVELEVVTLPRIAPVDASLASPPFQMDLYWKQIKPYYNVFQTPLERINGHMCTVRPEINQEWWLKGTLSLLMLGIPRQWHANEVLAHIMDAYDRILNWEEVISEDLRCDMRNPFEEHNTKLDQMKWCQKIGLQKFVLLFGNTDVAVNGIPFQFPRGGVAAAGLGNGVGTANIRAGHITNEQPDAMALLIFDSEARALHFWSSMSASCIRAYPSTITVCPDPSGWRIYTEALSLWFQSELMTQAVAASTSATLNKEDGNEDLLSVLTNKSTDEPTPKQKPIAQLTFVSPFVSNPDDATEIANSLTKIGVKCMYHKPSKIMSLQFPNEARFSSLAVCHRYFISPSGARVHCCFLRCLNKFLPIVKRTNVEHISNAVEKNKTGPSRPPKFKPPSVGIITVESMATD